VLVTKRGRWLPDAMACFEQAVALDPDLAEAHALLGDCHRIFALYELAPASERMPLARAAAQRALALDPDQAEAMATLASIAVLHDWSPTASNQATDRLLARHPTHVRAMCERAATSFALADAGPADWEKSLQEIRRARALDPLNAWVCGVHAMTLCLAHRMDEGVAEARHGVALDAANFTCRWALLNALAETGRHHEVEQEAESALAMSGRHPVLLGILAASRAARGDRPAAGAVHQEITERTRVQYVSSSQQAVIAASAGHLEVARALMLHAVADREPGFVFWKMYGWSHFRADPEGRRILEGTGVAKR
jgi:serine/threonine-protein kinase